ncbi:6fa5d7bb-dc4a-439d-a3a5-54cb82495443-CDS [Sclerotinia trifoliorum]|uniref:Iron-sulfur cluster assembly factor IBA57 homolog, mitochondrial n=1 Tax=Sclerotinia trifoliorum TaxID=28548 RepID=A0A8H2VTV1_9HELO|nr:6fa5d7bb-dc4a-439d-a3a5-54cb82495443-CDS [Sclerotinia trifoliorum]
MKSISKFLSKRPVSVPANAYICNSCSGRRTIEARPRNRKCSSASTPASTQNPTSSSIESPFKLPKKGIARLSTRRLISLRGPDSTKYLQGVITNDIYKEGNKNGFYSAFLNAQGRVLNDVWIYRDIYADLKGGKTTEGDNWLIEVDAKQVEILAKHIKRYRMRAKFDVEIIDEEEKKIYSLWGTKVGVRVIDALERDREKATQGIVTSDTRAPGMGNRVIVNKGWHMHMDIQDAEVQMHGEDVYRVRRYLIGVPEGQDEILRESALPQESNIDVMGGIDYTKGCYVGQELTIRTHHMGVIRKRIVPMMLVPDGEDMPGLGELKYKGGNLASWLNGGENIKKVGGKRPVGKWLSGVGNLGLGLARLDEMGKWMVEEKEADGVDEFVVEGKGEKEGEVRNIRVRAFPPAWIET